MRKTNYIKMTMPDGSIWKINIDSLKVTYLVHVKGIRDIRALEDETKNLPSTDEDFIKIVREELQWHQVRVIAVCVQPAVHSDYDSIWQRGAISIVEEEV